VTDNFRMCAKISRTLSSKFKIFTTPLNTELGTLTEGGRLLNEWVSQGFKKETLCMLCGREVEFTEVLCPECKPKFQKFLKRAPDVDISVLSNRKPLNARADQTREDKRVPV